MASQGSIPRLLLEKELEDLGLGFRAEGFKELNGVS